jgi:membrane dipeptidase
MVGKRSRQHGSTSSGSGGLRRREFLRLAAAGALACAWPSLAHTDGPDPLAGLTVIDIHAHPEEDADRTARTADLAPAGMSAACYAAVGDTVWSRGKPDPRTEYDAVRDRLRRWLDGPVARGEVGLVRAAADIPGPGAARPGAILAIEGGDPLEGRVERVDEFHKLGVRVITLIHYRNNALGDVMYARQNSPDPGPYRHGLSPAGRAVVARMEDLGMLVDVAHASAETLRDVLAVARKPVVDSHTGPCRRESAGDAAGCSRARTWEEMERVAEAGGVVCSWSMGKSSGGVLDFAGWARDILEMRDRLGPQAVGLGTDSGGRLPAYVQGYRSWRDLRQLAAALLDAGMTRDDLAAFLGGNVLRVLQKCLG